MFDSSNRLIEAANLARLLADVISKLSVYPQFSAIGEARLKELGRVSGRLTRYLEQAVDGANTVDWFQAEAMSLRGELTRIANSPSFRTDKPVDTALYDLSTGKDVVTSEDISRQLVASGVPDNELARHFVKIAHDILDQIDSISNFTSTNPYKSRIIRTIKAKPDHVQVISSVLNYFSRVVHQKGMEESVKIRSEISGSDLLFVIEFNPRDAEVIDEMFYNYGKVIIDKMLPGDFLNSPSHALELKNKLEMAKLELRQTLEIMHLERSGTSARIADLEKEIDWLKCTFEKSLNQNNSLSEAISSIAKNSSDQVKDHLSVVLRRMENGFNEADRPKIMEHLSEIGKKEPLILKKIKEISEKTVISASSAQLLAWISIILKGISG